MQMNGMLPLHQKRNMKQESSQGQSNQSWMPRPRTILLLLLLVFSLQSLFWFGEHLAVDEQLEKQKHQTDQLRMDILKLTAKVEENGLRLLRHDKWFEDHLETFKLLRSEQKQGEKDEKNGRMGANGNHVASKDVLGNAIKPAQNSPADKDDGIKMVVGILSAKRKTPAVLKMVRMLMAELNLKQFKVEHCQ